MGERKYVRDLIGRFAETPGGGGSKTMNRMIRDLAGVDSGPLGPSEAAAQLVARATAAEPRLTGYASLLAEQRGGALAGLDFRLKTTESLTRKLAGDMEETGTMDAGALASKMYDVNRYTAVFSEADYSSSTQSTLDNLRADGNTIRVKNYWNNQDNPYQGINVQITSPNGDRWELQFHTQTSLAVKNGHQHTLYEEMRVSKDPKRRAELAEEIAQLSAEIPVPPGVTPVE